MTKKDLHKFYNDIYGSLQEKQKLHHASRSIKILDIHNDRKACRLIHAKIKSIFAFNSMIGRLLF